ncbi:MAG TPA: GDSL-type esterase/lipase family protein, partial [Solirubrobacterales bacterium]|nr:GDSL-type esterase/lipase family protein [Solirubrobacterales bacterium]
MSGAESISRWASPALLSLLLIVLAPVASAAAAQAPPFDWTMPARLGGDGDGDGLLDYAGSAAEFEEEEEAREGFPVELEVRRDLCRKDATYTWHSPAGSSGGQGKAGCAVTQTFPREGEYPVRLEVRFAGGRTLSFDRKVTVQDWLVVSIGDSVASGEGNPDHRGGLFRRARWKSARCHRSAKAGPALAAFELEAADPRTSATFVHLACSGAEIGTGLLRGYRGVDAGPNAEPRLLPPQVAELERIAATREVDAVLLSIGANDVYFGPIVAFCLLKRKCTAKPFVPDEEPRPAPRPLEEVVGDALGRLPQSYATLADRLADVVPSNRVLIVEYFDSTKDENGEICPQIGFANPFRSVQIDQDEARWAAAHVLEPLNATVAKAADGAGWTLVGGVAEAFRTHGYCAEESWIRHIGESWREQKGETPRSRLTGALHPNGDGHRQEGEMIGLGLAEVLYGGPLSGAASDSVVVTVDSHDGPNQSDGEGELEEAALIGLGVATALAGLAALALGRRRPRDEEGW